MVTLMVVTCTAICGDEKSFTLKKYQPANKVPHAKRWCSLYLIRYCHHFISQNKYTKPARDHSLHLRLYSLDQPLPAIHQRLSGERHANATSYVNHLLHRMLSVILCCLSLSIFHIKI